MKHLFTVTKSRLTKTKGSLFLLVMLLAFFSGYAQQAQKALEYTGASADARIEGAVYVKQKPGALMPDFVRLSEEQKVPVDEFFSWLNSTSRGSGDYTFGETSRKKDKSGRVHFRYEQMYNGVAVDQTHFYVHTENDMVYAFNGITHDVRGANTRPRLSPDQALEFARQFVGAESYMWESANWEAELKERRKNQDATYFPEAKLVIVPDRTGNGQHRIAYRFDISALSPMKEVRVCVDAETGGIIYDVPMESNCEAANVNTIFNGNRNISTELYTDDDYRLRDDCIAAVVHVRDWNSPNLTPNPTEIENTDNNWTTTNEIFGGTVLWQTKRAYAYFKNTFGRDSYDDANGDVSALINAWFGCAPPPPMCQTANNASMSFSGGNMKVGLSSAGVLTNSYATVDIIGHEYAHAVTGATAMLVYEDEWGALNESFSDIFGETIENFALGGNDWLIGSERDNGAIRSMSNPNAGNDPDTYQGTNWVNIVPPCDNTNDQCGVHTNSGVQNFWFFLLTVGGSGTNDNGDDYQVDGIGIADAEAIAYDNLVTYLGANSDYSDARAGSIQSAIDLFGECSVQHEAVMDAWYAVGVGDPFLTVVAEVTSDYNGRDISCYGASDGEVTATATFGAGGYSYSWSNEANGAVNSGNPSGTYFVTVTDDDGCTATASVTLQDPPQLSASAFITSNYNGWPISCAGACDGSAESNGIGGTSPYSFQWGATSENQATKEATNLCAGTHYVTVTDANGCTATNDITLEEPPPLEIEAGDNQTIFYWDINLACTSLEATGATGGVPPYTYEWSSGGTDTGEDVCLEMREDTVTTVTYYVTLTDLNGCEVVDSVDVCYVDINCGKGNSTKVFICHYPPGNPLNAQTLCVSLSALPEHLSHGDELMYCGFVSPCDPEAMAFVNLPDQQALFEKAFDGQSLLTVFPNPFTESTTIRFILHNKTTAHLQIFRLDGSLARDLYSGEVLGGEIYDISLQKGDLAPGVYIARLMNTAGEMLNTKLLVR